MGMLVSRRRRCRTRMKERDNRMLPGGDCSFERAIVSLRFERARRGCVDSSDRTRMDCGSAPLQLGDFDIWL